MDLMQRYFKPHLEQIMVIFIDDILIYSTNREEHENQLGETLSILRKSVICLAKQV